MTPRDIVKLAFQYQETEEIPYCFDLSSSQASALTHFYGSSAWQAGIRRYVAFLDGVDNFLSKVDWRRRSDGYWEDCLGCVWNMGSTHHLVDWPLHEPRMGNYRLPALVPYFEQVRSSWPAQIAATGGQFRIISHSFGLFERAWSLRGFENFLVDMVENESFAEELLDRLTDWFLQSVDLMAAVPVDAIMLTDDHAAQRGLLMGSERWRRLFKPRWKRIFDRVHHYGLYTILHMCGDTSEVVPDLIEVGLDCMESCQPECMDIYRLKALYGNAIRFWGGLGAQHTLPFGTPEEVKKETARLKTEMARGGGYILAGAKGLGEEVPVENIAAYLEECRTPRRSWR
jgi:uroporphyrinogen decarboxylase